MQVPPEQSTNSFSNEDYLAQSVSLKRGDTGLRKMTACFSRVTKVLVSPLLEILCIEKFHFRQEMFSPPLGVDF